MIRPVILSGGSGTRLWPLSRELYPKQLLPLLGKRTLLQDTVGRLEGFTDTVERPIIVCNEEHRFLVAEQLREIGAEAERIVLEPEGRNTAPALTLAALTLAEHDPEQVMLVMPADHVIRNLDAFRAAVGLGRDFAEQGHVVTFGIVPTQPETGYGYIKRGAARAADGAFALECFVEKPDAATAAQYVKAGDYFWNSGMFMLRADVWLKAVREYRPEIARACEEALAAAKQDFDFYRVDADAFRACPSDSIDYAVMERLTAGEQGSAPATVVPLAAEWSDIGAWSALWELGDKDEHGNVSRGDVFAHDTRNSIMFSDRRMVAALGVDNLVIVETADAVMVARRDRAQDVKVVVDWLKQNNREERRSHRRVYRPWGTYESLNFGSRYQVKCITVNPNCTLSLQMHHHRAEHWVVVRGTAKVTRGNEVFLVSENESTYIPLGTAHRLENPGFIPLEIIEVQSGAYLGEDDIVRFDDQYGRAN